MAMKPNLEQYGIQVREVVRNAAPARLYEAALGGGKDTAVARSGALIIRSGEKTGRSPTDKRIVEHSDSADDIWWDSVNIKLDEHTFMVNRERALDYLNHAGAPLHRGRIRGVGSVPPAQGAHHLLPPLSRAVHAQHAHPPDRGRARELR